MKFRPVVIGFALLAFTALATPARVGAQDLGLLVGLNSANVEFEFEDVNLSVDRQNGFVGGLTFNHPFMDVAGVEVDALVAQKGTQFDFGGGEAGTITLLYLDIPVLARVNLRASDAGGIHLLAGPSFNIKRTRASIPTRATRAWMKSRGSKPRWFSAPV